MLLNRGTNAPNIALHGPACRDRVLWTSKGGFGPLFRGSTVIAASGAWHHLVVTRSGAARTYAKIYLDGVADGDGRSPLTTLTNNSEVLDLRRKNVGPIERWGGKLDEIADSHRRRALRGGGVQPRQRGR